MCAAVLEGTDNAVGASIHGIRAAPEDRLEDLALVQIAIPANRVPVVGMHTRDAHLLPAVARLLEARGLRRVRCHHVVAPVCAAPFVETTDRGFFRRRYRTVHG